MADTPDDRSKTRAAWVAIVVSVVGLVGTNVWSTLQFASQGDQLATQEAALAAQQQQLARAEEEFAAARGLLTVTANVVAVDDATGKWTASREEGGIYRNQVIDASFIERHRTWLQLQVTNVGTGPTDILRAGMLFSDEDKLQAGTVECFDALEETDPVCAFPMTIEARSTEYVYVLLDELTDAMTCNPYVEARGLVGGIRNVDNDLYLADSTTRVAWSDYCESSSPPPD